MVPCALCGTPLAENMSKTYATPRKRSQSAPKTDEEVKPLSKKQKREADISNPNLQIELSHETEPEPNNNPETEEEIIPCCINIQFLNDYIAETYKEKFLSFVETFRELQVRSQTKCSIDIDVSLIPLKEDVNYDAIKDTPITKKKRKRPSKLKKELFVVDAAPSSEAAQLDLKYTTKYAINTEKATEHPVQKSKKVCFNCGSLHSLKECPQPKDYFRINAAKARTRQSMRYHLEEGQQFAHLIPGKISKQLREALALNENEAPAYIYSMRHLGYPPGWLEEAKSMDSNLDVFDGGGENMKTANKKCSLDVGKIVEYPGFNVPFDEQIKDEYETYGVPPYSENFSKEVMLHFLETTVQEEDSVVVISDTSTDSELGVIGTQDSTTVGPSAQQKRDLSKEFNLTANTDKIDSSLVRVKRSCFGTPILKTGSPYSDLPCPDNFSKGICPLINYENLPNSTGKYEQMLDVLQKIRAKMRR